MTVDEVSATIKTFFECEFRPFFVSGGNGLEIVVTVGAMHRSILHISDGVFCVIPTGT